MFVLTHVSPVLFWPLFWQKQPPLCLPLRFGWHHYLTHTHTLSRVSWQNSVPYFALIMWREPKSGLNFREWKNRNLLLYGNLHNGKGCHFANYLQWKAVIWENNQKQMINRQIKRRGVEREVIDGEMERVLCWLFSQGGGSIRIRRVPHHFLCQ